MPINGKFKELLLFILSTRGAPTTIIALLFSFVGRHSNSKKMMIYFGINKCTWTMMGQWWFYVCVVQFVNCEIALEPHREKWINWMFVRNSTANNIAASYWRPLFFFVWGDITPRGDRALKRFKFRSVDDNWHQLSLVCYYIMWVELMNVDVQLRKIKHVFFPNWWDRSLRSFEQRYRKKYCMTREIMLWNIEYTKEFTLDTFRFILKRCSAVRNWSIAVVVASHTAASFEITNSINQIGIVIKKLQFRMSLNPKLIHLVRNVRIYVQKKHQGTIFIQKERELIPIWAYCSTLWTGE